MRTAMVISTKTALAVILAFLMLGVPGGDPSPEGGERPADEGAPGPVTVEGEPLVIEKSSGSARADYVELNDPLFTYYPGDRGVTFTISVDETYTAPGNIDPWSSKSWTWNDPYWADENWVYGVEIDIKGISDDSGAPANVVDWVYDEPWNDGPQVGDDTYPINFTNSHTFRADDGDDGQVDFEFDVAAVLSPGTYYLKVDVDYKIITDYDNTDPISKTNPRLSSQSYSGVIEFEIRSGVEPAPYDESIPATGYDNGNPASPIPLYSGAQFQEVRVPVAVAGAVGTLTQIVGTPSSPSGASITLDPLTPDSEISSLPPGGTGELKYRVDVAEDQAPVVTRSSLLIEYNRDIGGEEVEIRESLRVEWVVDFTPLLVPQGSDTGTGEFLTVTIDEDFNQGEDYNSIPLTIGFTNKGNVPLQDLEVTLDLTNARYLYTSTYYYDEGAQATKISFPPLTATVDSLGVGYSANIPFSFDVGPTIQPGKYVIPIVYEGWYMNTGITGQATGFVKTDVGLDYSKVMEVRKEFWTEPFIYLEVKDTSVNITAKTVTENITSADEGVTIEVEVTNDEDYTMNDVTAYVQAGPGTPFLNPRGDEVTELDGFYIGTMAPGVTQTCAFKADVARGFQNAEFRGVVVLLTGTDTLSGDISRIYTLDNPITASAGYIEVLPVPPPPPPTPPILIIEDVHSDQTVLDADDEYALTITVRNIGDQNASDVQILLVDDNDLLHPVQSTKTLDLPLTTENYAGQSSSVTFDILVDPNVELGAYYQATVLMQYTDDYGEIHNFYDDVGTDITVRIKEEEPPEPEPEPVFDLPLAVLILGILTLIAFMIAGAVISTGLRNMGRGGEAKALPKRRGRDDDEDEDMDKGELDDEPPGPRPAGGPQPLPGPGARPQAGGASPKQLPSGGGPPPAGGPYAGDADYYEPPPPDDGF